MRYLLAVLLMGLLAACDLGAASPTEEPLPSLESMAASHDADESMEADESEDADASGDADASMDGSDDMTASCEEAWDEIDVSGISSIGDLEGIADDVDTTIDECGDLQTWADEAQDALPDLSSEELEGWAAARCSENDTLSESPICVEINS